MNIEDFEKHAQAEFERYRPTADHDEIWDKIEPHLPKKRKRRPFILFFWGLGIGLLGLLLWNQMPSATQAVERAANATKQEIQPGNQPGNQSAPLNPQKPEVSGKKTSDPVSSTGLYAKAQNTIEAPNSAIKSKKPSEKARRQFTSKTPAASTASRETAQVRPTEKELTSNSATVSVPLGANPTLPFPSNPTSNNQAETGPNAAPSTSGQDTLDQRSNQVLTHKKPAAKAKARTKPHKRKPSNHSLALHSGPALPIKVLRQNEQVDANEELLNNRKQSEKSLEAFSVGLNYTYTTKSGWMFQAGLDYRRLNEKFQLSYQTVETQTVTGVLTQTVNAAGQVIAQTSGPKQITTTTTYSNVAYNSHQFVYLPIGMGYQKRQKRSRWEITGGFDLNLWYQFQGTQYNEYGKAVPVEAPWYSAVYKRNAGLGLWGSYGYSRNITRNIRWQASAKINVPFQPITSNQYALIQRYYLFGIQGGLVFAL